jgi:hypothetical protein
MFSPELKINYIGNNKEVNGSIINQIKFYEDPVSNNLYLFVASEKNLFHIYSL